MLGVIEKPHNRSKRMAVVLVSTTAKPKELQTVSASAVATLQQPAVESQKASDRGSRGDCRNVAKP